MRSQRRLWPCVGRRPELDPAGGVFGSAFGSPLYLNISTKIFAIAYSYGECIIKSGRHIF